MACPWQPAELPINYRLRSIDAAGKQTLRVLDRSVLSASNLDDAVRNRLQNHFQSVIDDHPEESLTVIFRKGGPVGPNAFGSSERYNYIHRRNRSNSPSKMTNSWLSYRMKLAM